MKGNAHKGEVDGLIREIQRYLAFVQALRRVSPPRGGTGGKSKCGASAAATRRERGVSAV